MGEGVVVTLDDVAALEGELRDKLDAYSKSLSELDDVMKNATEKSIQGPLAEGIRDKYEKKGPVFAQIKTELTGAADYMGDQQDRLNKTINKVSDGLQ